MPKSSLHLLLQFFDKRDVNILPAARRVHSERGDLRKERYKSRYLIFDSLVTEISAALKAPTLVCSNPVCESVEIPPHLSVNISTPARHLLQVFEKLDLHRFMIIHCPLHGAVQIGVEFVHYDGENVVVVVADSLLLVVRHNVLGREISIDVDFYTDNDRHCL